ncbi:DUF6270 domain-containing protein [Aeromonas veronii]
MKKILIIGSCVSRDAFDKDEFDITYFARSSLISAMSEIQYCKSKYPTNITSNFQNRTVVNDLSKELLKLMQSESLKKFDIILIDFIDERFNLFRNIDGAFATISNELKASDFFFDDGETIISGSESWFQLWCQAWDNFIELVSDLKSKIKINNVIWANDNKTSLGLINSENDLLKRIYSYIDKDISSEQFVFDNNFQFLTNSEHKWGAAPYHYSDHVYDIIRHQCIHGIHLSEKISATVNKVSKNGFHTIKFDEHRSLSILSSNMHLVDDIVLICFSGAVGFRNGEPGPFYSGRGISHTLNLPLISISDPSLDAYLDLKLGWYGGNEKFPDCQSYIAKILDEISKALGVKLVIFGGSGGGFASIAISSMMSVSADVFVWNPQTSITGYVKEFTFQYATHAFKILNAQKQISANSTEDELYSFFDMTGIIHDLRSLNFNQKSRIFYLQNNTDWHVEKHAHPFLAEQENNSIHYIELNFADGHTPPSKEIIEFSLTKIIELSDSVEVKQEIVRFIEDKSWKNETSRTDVKLSPMKEIDSDIKLNKTSALLSENKNTTLTLADLLSVNYFTKVSTDKPELIKFPYSTISLEFTDQFNWCSESHSLSNSDRMWFYSLNYIGNLITQKVNIENALIKSMTESFLDYIEQKENRKKVFAIPSGDHASSTRLLTLIALALHFSSDQELTTRIKSEISETISWILDDKNYKANNHGLMTSYALIFFYLFQCDNNHKVFDVAINRVINLSRLQFDQKGYCNENSVGYHNFNIFIYKKVTSLLERFNLTNSKSEELLNTISLAERATKNLILPTGEIPPIGDSPKYKINIDSVDGNFLSKESGIAVVKKNGFYLSVLCGSASETHKQMDESSIYLHANGEDIIIDAGSYSYDVKDPYRRSISSSLGHSGIYPSGIDGLNRSEFIKEYGRVITDIDLEETDDLIIITCSYAIPELDFYCQRKIQVKNYSNITIVDTFSSKIEVRQRFLLSPSLDLKKNVDDDFLFIGTNTLTTLSSTVKQRKIYKGEEGLGTQLPRAWCSYKFGEKIPIHEIEFTPNLNETEIKTTLNIVELYKVD